MIDVITRGSLGEFGSLLLDFYINNAIWINSIIAIYAFLVVWAHVGYQRVGERIKEELIATHGESVKNKSEAWFAKAISRAELNWEIIAAQIKIPFITPKNSILIRVKSANSIEKLFTPAVIKALFSEDHS